MLRSCPLTHSLTQCCYYAHSLTHSLTLYCVIVMLRSQCCILVLTHSLARSVLRSCALMLQGTSLAQSSMWMVDTRYGTYEWRYWDEGVDGGGGVGYMVCAEWMNGVGCMVCMDG